MQRSMIRSMLLKLIAIFALLDVQFHSYIEPLTVSKSRAWRPPTNILVLFVIPCLAAMRHDFGLTAAVNDSQWLNTGEKFGLRTTAWRLNAIRAL